MLLRIFCQFQSGVAYKSVAYKTKRVGQLQFLKNYKEDLSVLKINRAVNWFGGIFNRLISMRLHLFVKLRIQLKDGEVRVTFFEILQNDVNVMNQSLLLAIISNVSQIENR